MKKRHLYFKNPVEGVKKYRQKSRYVPPVEESEQVKNYHPMQDSFDSSLKTFLRLQKERDEQRNRSISIPYNIEYIIFNFFDCFDSVGFENAYRKNFGLVPIRYEEFNSVGYFAVEDKTKFQSFIENVEEFIKDGDPENSTSFNPIIKFIKSFTFHSSDKIKNYTEPKGIFIIELFDSLDLFDKYNSIIKSLFNYLESKHILFNPDDQLNKIEIVDTDQEVIKEIINNFDIIHSVNSSLAGIIKPSKFNLPIREFGFTILNAEDDLPIIGIIDTGISDQTPLKPLIINVGNEFNITGTGPCIDNADHGTGVAALAALGKSLYPDHIGNYQADAKLLSIKVLDDNSGPLSEISVENLIREANRKYGIKIFVLTIAYKDGLPDNANISAYGYALDLLSYELDILIFISVGNVHDIINHIYEPNGTTLIPYPENYKSPSYNLCSPSDSMNNISCGAISDNLESFDTSCYSPDPSFPASYSRKFNLNRNHSLFKATRLSKHLGKPDSCFPGGDYDDQTQFESTGIKILSSRTGIFFERVTGTSYSAPLLANLAAKILKTYPALSQDMQTVKALILNSASLPQSGNYFSRLNGMKLEDLIGKGIPDFDKTLYSDENRVTLILEDSIRPEEIKSYPIKIPKYLNRIPSTRSLLEVCATICFKINPIPHNQLTYCPINISFGIFKNLPLEQTIRNEEGNIEFTGINGNSTENYVFRESWSQDYYFKAKMLSNCQKIKTILTKANLESEDNEFKIVLSSKFHKLLSPELKDKNDREHPFSLVVSLREKPIAGTISNLLYDEIQLINELELIGEMEAEADLTTD